VTEQEGQAAGEPTLRIAGIGDAPSMLRIIREAFSARPSLDPPADAFGDDLAAIADRLASQVGIIASVGGRDAGCLFLSSHEDGVGMLHRVSVLPDQRQHGVAAEMVRAAAHVALDLGLRRIRLIARRELPQMVAWWGKHGFTVVDELDEHRYVLSTELPVRVVVPTADDMRLLGVRLARLMRAGDLVVASGELGAGKTTLTQGLGEGLGVEGPITSPTFVLSRIHPARNGGPALVHVDAYRLGSAAELEDIDLDSSLAETITIVEWGEGLAEGLSDDRLEIEIDRSGDVADDTRTVLLRGVGERWQGVDLQALVPDQEAL